MRKPLVIDLFCGLGGWTKGFLSEGWGAIGFDIERHRYPKREVNLDASAGADQAPLTGELAEYPAQLVLQDVLTLDGRQFRGHADMIVASPPCQEYSYTAMPWKRAKEIARSLRGEGEFPQDYTGSRTIEQLNALFRAALRIAKEAQLPILIENVKGAQPWVGRAQANYGSYYLWGDIAQVGGRIVRPDRVAFGMASVKAMGRGAAKFNPDGTEHPQGSWFAVADCFNDPSWPGKQGGTKQRGSGPEWFDNGIASHGSRSNARKAASAMIAEIPFDLASYVARVFKP
jgi:hypothetical protein